LLFQIRPISQPEFFFFFFSRAISA
jgi:hypothetical protein